MHNSATTFYCIYVRFHVPHRLKVGSIFSLAPLAKFFNTSKLVGPLVNTDIVTIVTFLKMYRKRQQFVKGPHFGHAPGPTLAVMWPWLYETECVWLGGRMKLIANRERVLCELWTEVTEKVPFTLIGWFHMSTKSFIIITWHIAIMRHYVPVGINDKGGGGGYSYSHHTSERHTSISASCPLSLHVCNILLHPVTWLYAALLDKHSCRTGFFRDWLVDVEFFTGLFRRSSCLQGTIRQHLKAFLFAVYWGMQCTRGSNFQDNVLGLGGSGLEDLNL